MNTIWEGTITLDMLNSLNKGSMGDYLGIKFTEIGENYLVASMPVNSNTKQPFGLLHGGASVALAETIGSVATWCCINREIFIGVGVEINASHLKSANSGIVMARCWPIKSEGKLKVWAIEIRNQKDELLCTCRFTCMVVPKPPIA
ncbi:MAG: hotdog fold thioesterase [Bacteroidia bacterium]|jgi:1,4-dihydroxy-2-naphthoyl-CoA hydrolase|nr:hotdog fold thioesterase [Bacteroidia bacterium]